MQVQETVDRTQVKRHTRERHNSLVRLVSVVARARVGEADRANCVTQTTLMSWVSVSSAVRRRVEGSNATVLSFLDQFDRSVHALVGLPTNQITWP